MAKIRFFNYFSHNHNSQIKITENRNVLEQNNVHLYAQSCSSHMRDICIRQLLKQKQLAFYISDKNSKVVDELSLPVAKARIDIAVINGAFHGYEIKSASDTLQRLPSQIEAYIKVFDYLSIVTEKKYTDKILHLVPKFIGLIECTENSVKILRKPKLNKNKDGFFIAKLLWREEIIDILTEYQIPFRKKDRNWILCEVLSSNLNIELLSDIVRDKLKNRLDWKMML